MSNSVTIRDVAGAAGVSISTVSFVVNGKAEKYRISHVAQVRVLAAVRQLGYESNPIINTHLLNQAISTNLSTEAMAGQNSSKEERQIVLALSAASPPDSIAMILATEPALAAAGYDLVVIVLPADPAAVRERVSMLLHDGTAGIVCCPSIYPVVSAIVAKECPVIVLWQGAGKAMVGMLQAVSVDPEPPTVPKPVVNVAPVVEATVAPPSPTLHPVVAAPVSVIRPVQPAIEVATGGVVSSPNTVHDPVSVPEDAVDTAPTIVIAEESPVVFAPAAEDPVTTPAPEIEDLPESPGEAVQAEATTPVFEPELSSAEISLGSVPVSEDAADTAPTSAIIEERPVVSTPVVEDPVTTPAPKIEDLPASPGEAVQAEATTPVFEPESPSAEISPDSIPVSEDVVDTAPITVISEERPVVLPSVVEEPVETPEPDSKTVFVQPTAEPDPIVVPYAPWAPTPESNSPVSETVVIPPPPMTPEPTPLPIIVETPAPAPEPVPIVVPEPMIVPTPVPVSVNLPTEVILPEPIPDPVHPPEEMTAQESAATEPSLAKDDVNNQS